jgi:hypothetical protein
MQSMEKKFILYSCLADNNSLQNKRRKNISEFWTLFSYRAFKNQEKVEKKGELKVNVKE